MHIPIGEQHYIAAPQASINKIHIILTSGDHEIQFFFLFNLMLYLFLI